MLVMIKFNPESLRDDIVTILKKFNFLEGEIEGVTFNEIMDKDCYEDYDVDITKETKICLFIGADDSPYVSFEFLKNIFNKWENSKINEAQSYAKNTNEIYFLLNTEDYDSFMFLETLKTSGNSVVKTTEPGVSIWEKQINIDNKNYMVSLYNGICLYHLKVQESENYDKYFGHYNNVYSFNGMNTTMTKYPVGVMTQQVLVPDAKAYYTALQAKPNRVGYSHTSPAWLVAVNEERRKEFNSEWCLCPDMVRSGYIEDHINYNYPKDDGGSDYANYPWTKRSFNFDIKKMDMPIPADEILKNPALKQNPGYEKIDENAAQ